MENSVIKVCGLKKSFGEKEVLKGIDMEINRGDVVGYLGSNGAGKSTTVKIMCGLIPTFGGEVEILGNDLRKESTIIKSKIGYVPENAVMYEQLTPLEYLGLVGTLYQMPKELQAERIDHYLKVFDMKGEESKRMINFSKGMKQKIHLISGLLHDPEVLFLDEPLNGLDANSVIIVKELISKLAAEGKTIFYCSHLMDVVEKIANRIILLNNGVLVADGSPEELMTGYKVKSLESLFTTLTSTSL